MKYEDIYRDIAIRVLSEGKNQEAISKLIFEMTDITIKGASRIMADREPEKEIDINKLVEEIASKKPISVKEPEIIVDDNEQLRLV